MTIKSFGLRRFFVYLYRILLLTGLLLGIGAFALGLTFFYKFPKNQITVNKAIAEQLYVDKIDNISEKTKPIEQQKAEANVEKFTGSEISLPSNEINSTDKLGRFTILLAGIDRRPEEKSMSNTDTLVIAQVDAQLAKVRLLSVPRDTQVEFPGYGKEKINAVARLGKGLKTTESYLKEVCGQPIDGYVLTNFAGFKDIIDTLGGINLTVEKDMYYVTGDKQDGIINLKKGTQRLNGTQALQYARFRQDALADISRTMRQQAVLKAMAKEFGQVKTLSKLPWLIPQVYRNVQTDLSLGQIWSLANVFTHFNSIEIVSQTLPGNFIIEKGISYWKVNLDQAHKVTHDFFTEGKTAVVFSPDLSSEKGSLRPTTSKRGTGEMNQKQESQSDSEGQDQTSPMSNKTEISNTSELPEFEFEINAGGQ